MPFSKTAHRRLNGDGRCANSNGKSQARPQVQSAPDLLALAAQAAKRPPSQRLKALLDTLQTVLPKYEVCLIRTGVSAHIAN